MAESITTIVMSLFVINLGIAFGGGLYESRIVVPQWLRSSPESGYRWNAEAASSVLGGPWLVSSVSGANLERVSRS